MVKDNKAVAFIVAVASMLVFKIHWFWLESLDPVELTLMGDLGALIVFASIIGLFVEDAIALKAMGVLFSDM